MARRTTAERRLVRSTRRALAAVLLFMWWWLALGSGAAAQVPGGYQGLFRPDEPVGALPARVRTGTLDLAVHAFGSYEREQAPAAPPDGPGEEAALRGGLRGDARYARTRARYALVVGGSSFVRQEADARGVRLDTQRGESTLALDAGRRLRFDAVQRVSYSPLRSSVPGTAALVPGPDPVISPDDVAAARASLSLGTTLGVTRQVSRRTEFSTRYRYERSTISEGGITASAQFARAELKHLVRRGFDLRGGYAYVRAVTDSAAALSPAHTHQAGIRGDYVLPFSEATTVSVAATPTLIALGSRGGLDVAFGSQGGTTFSLGGLAQVEHRMGDTTRIGVGYQRAASYLQGYDEPIVANALTGRLDVRLHRRLLARGWVFYSEGRPAVHRDRGRSSTLSSSIRLESRWGSATALFVEYARDGNDLSGSLGGGPAVARRSARHTVRTGVTMDLPARRHATR